MTPEQKKLHDDGVTFYINRQTKTVVRTDPPGYEACGRFVKDVFVLPEMMWLESGYQIPRQIKWDGE